MTPVAVRKARPPRSKRKTRRRPPTAITVGSNLSGMVFFKDGEFLNFSTPNKDFTMHLGGWVQWDNVWWNQSPALKVAQGLRHGPP